MAFRRSRSSSASFDVRPPVPGKIAKGETFTNTRTNRKVRIGRLCGCMPTSAKISTLRSRRHRGRGRPGLRLGRYVRGPGADYALESIFVPEPVIKLSIDP